MIYDPKHFLGPIANASPGLMDNEFNLNISPVVAVAAAILMMDFVAPVQPTLYFARVQAEISHLKKAYDTLP